MLQSWVLPLFSLTQILTLYRTWLARVRELWNSTSTTLHSNDNRQWLLWICLIVSTIFESSILHGAGNFWSCFGKYQQSGSLIDLAKGTFLHEKHCNFMTGGADTTFLAESIYKNNGRLEILYTSRSLVQIWSWWWNSHPNQTENSYWMVAVHNWHFVWQMIMWSFCDQDPPILTTFDFCTAYTPTCIHFLRFPYSI